MIRIDVYEMKGIFLIRFYADHHKEVQGIFPPPARSSAADTLTKNFVGRCLIRQQKPNKYQYTSMEEKGKEEQYQQIRKHTYIDESVSRDMVPNDAKLN